MIRPAQTFFFSLLALLFASAVQADVCADWTAFKARFLSSDGRVVDRFQGNASHSEGQGYGLIVAVVCEDRAAFDAIGEWTRNNLQVRRTDSLLAWSWGERFPGQWAVLDFNNATDGDILVAWGLLLGAREWGESNHKQSALSLIRSIREQLGFEKQGHFLLLPGYSGFWGPEMIRLNPSYFIFSAFQAFAEVDETDFWNRVHADSLALLQRSLASPWMLPPDWFLFPEKNDVAAGLLDPAKGMEFGFEAIRVPLYLSWAGKISALPNLPELLQHVALTGTIPQGIHLLDGTLSQESGSAGFHAVFARAADDLGMRETAGIWWEEAARKFLDEKDDYYSNILYVLSRLGPAPFNQANSR